MFDTFIASFVISRVIVGFLKGIITIASHVISLLFMLIAKAVRHYNEKNDQ